MAEKIKCEKCGGEYADIEKHMNNKHPEENGSGSAPAQQNDDEKDKPKAVQPKYTIDQLGGMLSSLVPVVKNLSDRLDTIETGGKGDFKKEVKAEDVKAAKSGREGVDPRTVQIVDETLGEDFGIAIEPNKDNPGFLFTVIVPRRLSDLSPRTRPVYDSETPGKYRMTPEGTPVEEEYWPEDRRSRAIASWQSYDAIRDHCERVRSYIVAYYQKTKKPIPEFKLKGNLR